MWKQALWSYWNKAFDFEDKTERAPFWIGYIGNYYIIRPILSVILYLILSFLCGVLPYLIDGSNELFWSAGYYVIWLIFSWLTCTLMFVIPTFALKVRRLRDAGFHPLWVLLTIFPILQLIVFIMLFFPTKKTDNQQVNLTADPDIPKNTSKVNKVEETRKNNQLSDANQQVSRLRKPYQSENFQSKVKFDGDKTHVGRNDALEESPSDEKFHQKSPLTDFKTVLNVNGDRKVTNTPENLVVKESHDKDGEAKNLVESLVDNAYGIYDILEKMNPAGEYQEVWLIEKLTSEYIDISIWYRADGHLEIIDSDDQALSTQLIGQVAKVKEIFEAYGTPLFNQMIIRFEKGNPVLPYTDFDYIDWDERGYDDEEQRNYYIATTVGLEYLNMTLDERAQVWMETRQMEKIAGTYDKIYSREGKHAR
ncbi:uncharacterized membrane protein YhaH (DUF805 family) [Weissella uvarum]|uniref:DUF805 domain-containing protein n=1 Tax=Weissella uvarum TaxID=1479233 RepID=UPI00195F43B2|nr:DUF805 domain-containing protein [Weissella uvarum]MBM7617956.1 uncharacterized membrane protein YhaH (DUF805 family) [Weissella uvarum]MCM0596175.1 DUF805 domain-containing protein [Weissella uvarum]